MCGATKLVYKLVQTSPFLTRSRLLFEFVITVVLVFLSFFPPFSLLNAHTLPGKLLFGFISFCCCCCCLQPVSFSRAYFHPTSFRLFIFYFFAIKKKKSTQTCVQFVHPLDFVSVHALARGTDPWGNVYYRLKGACVLNSCSLPHVYVFCNGTVAVLRYFIDALLSI